MRTPAANRVRRDELSIERFGDRFIKSPQRVLVERLPRLGDRRGALAAALGDDPEAPRILALSAYNDSAYIHGLLEAGAAGYITKDQHPTAVRRPCWRCTGARGGVS